MRLKRHHDYRAEFPDGSVRRVEFLGFAAKGICRVTDYNGPGPVYKLIPRFRLSELKPTPKQQDLFA